MALLLTAELLRFTPEAFRAGEVCTALTRSAASAGIKLTSTETYRGGARVLVVWGPGHPSRVEPMRRQLAAGGHVVALDLSYWQRDRKFRIAIDAAHPQAWVMRQAWPTSRFVNDHVPVSNTWQIDGPVIVAGLGVKARVQYGAAAIDAWEAAMITAARHHGRTVKYRRKKVDACVPAGVELAADGPIDRVLAGASLLVTWHSNVAIDAIRLGIPVVCRDGAAAAVCPSLYPYDPRPLPTDVRDQFLANLAWFQWDTTPQEARGCWAFLREVLA